jgi:hypothetical protein
MSICIVKCRCTDTPATDFQDKRYGKNKRVANYNAKGEASCSCCATIHRDVPQIERKKKKTGTGGGRSYTAVPPVGGWPGGLPEHNGWRPSGGR